MSRLLALMLMATISVSGPTLAGAIHIEARDGNIDAVKMLVAGDAGSASSITADEHLMPIHLAAQYGHDQIVKFLIENGSPVDPLDANSASPLVRASLRGQTRSVSVLIEAGADVNLVADEGVTPILLAAMNGHIDVVELLLESGANPNVKDATDTSPYDLALTEEIRILLRNHHD